MEESDIRACFGIVFQDYGRYEMTAGENIQIGNIGSTDAEIRNAAEKAHIAGIIAALPNQYHTALGKQYNANGTDLSGGQWQRLAIARAWVSDKPILILDEPTASLDPLEELRILEEFNSLSSGKTTIIISHRIGYARTADRILVMDKGRIAETGTHEELIHRDGIYHQMFMAQRELYAGVRSAS